MYKQLHPISEVSDKQNPSTTTFDSSSVLFYLQAVFILLIAGHKSLNNNLLKFAKHSQFHTPVLSSPQNSQTVSAPTKSFTCSTAPTCSPAGPPVCGGCQISGYAWEKPRCMCMLVWMLLTRTLGQLGKVGSKAVSCGELFRLFWGKMWQHTALLVLRMAVRLM